MQEWIAKHWTETKDRRLGSALLLALITLIILEIVALISDIGFSDEVRANRIRILILVLLTAISCVVIWFVNRYIQQVKRLRSGAYDLDLDNKRLQHEIADLKQQRDSILALMELYKPEAQESVIIRLKELAIISLRKRQWEKKQARIQRFRIEEARVSSDPVVSEHGCERVSVIINLGSNDGIMEGMLFNAQDPTDSLKYGSIRVTSVFDKGSVCAVIEMSHPAFWSDVLRAIDSAEGKIGIYSAAPNVIVAQNTLPDLNPQSAKQLLEWLQTIEAEEL